MNGVMVTNDKNDIVFKYVGTFKLDSPDEEILLAYMEKKYKGVVPQLLHEFEKTKNSQRVPNYDNSVYTRLMKVRANRRSALFQYEDGDWYPKNIPVPDIQRIQFAEPHILITDMYWDFRDWYEMPTLIKEFAEEAYLAYNTGMWYASIASAVNCCEYTLKYELLRHIHKKDPDKAEELSKDKHFTLGSFVNNTEYLSKLGILSFKNDIDYVNTVRVGLYHFSVNKKRKLQENGLLEVENVSSPFDKIIAPITAYRTYVVMWRLTHKFYNIDKAIEYVKESAEDYKRLKKEGKLKLLVLRTTST